MTLEQIQAYYSKHQKIERGEDSDEELPVRPLQATRNSRQGIVFRNDPIDPPIESRQPVEVHPNDEHARDLLEALNSYALPISDAVVNFERCEEILFSDDMSVPEL